MRIAKADFFAGVFLTTILRSAKGPPVYCEVSDGIKRLEFETDLGMFNMFVKYSTNEHIGWNYDFTPKKRKRYWSISFSDIEYTFLQNDFSIMEKINNVAIQRAKQFPLV